MPTDITEFICGLHRLEMFAALEWLYLSDWLDCLSQYEPAELWSLALDDTVPMTAEHLGLQCPN